MCFDLCLFHQLSKMLFTALLNSARSRNPKGDRRPDVCVSKLVEATCCLRDLAERLTNGLSSLLLKYTLPIPRDPLGLRHSRPRRSFLTPRVSTARTMTLIVKALFNLIFINYPTILFASHVSSAQDDSAGSNERPLGLNKLHFCKTSERYNSLPLWGSLGNLLPRPPYTSEAEIVATSVSVG